MGHYHCCCCVVVHVVLSGGRGVAWAIDMGQSLSSITLSGRMGLRASDSAQKNMVRACCLREC